MTHVTRDSVVSYPPFSVTVNADPNIGIVESMAVFFRPNPNPNTYASRRTTTRFTKTSVGIVLVDAFLPKRNHLPEFFRPGPFTTYLNPDEFTFHWISEECREVS